MSEQPANSNQVSVTSRQGLELVTDAYVRYVDVCFSWANIVQERHAGAIRALIDSYTLAHPDHPLRIAGEEGITLYIGIDYLGKPRLLFSLKQLQYLQYYIHEYRLTHPAWCAYYARRAELLKEEDGEAKAARLEQPEEEELADDWVPLPDGVVRASDFTQIVPHMFTSGPSLKRGFKLLEKEGKQAERHYRMNREPYVFDPLKLVAQEDNYREGPGLRKGPLRQMAPRGKGEEERPKGVGWGGFPLAASKGDVATQPEGETDSKQASAQPEVALPENGPIVDDRLVTPPSAPPGEQYHYHCQQALTLATQGGLANAISAAARQQGQSIEEALPEDLPEAVGRSLFLSLSVTRWEKDSGVILEVGWSGIWWQEKLGSEQDEADGTYEEMRDRGHHIVQDHLLDKKNGESKPDFRDNYLFGDSLPTTKDKLKDSIKQKIQDLSVKAGKGPIYIITHTQKGTEVDLKDIGLENSSLNLGPLPEGWDEEPYLSAAGCGSLFVINTAVLFGEIESPPNDVALPKNANRQVEGTEARCTTKSLQHVALLMFGQEPGRLPEKCGNAGNDAFYALEVFLAIMFGPKLSDLQADYQRALVEQASKTEVMRQQEKLKSADSAPKTTPPEEQTKTDGCTKEHEEEQTSLIQTVPLTTHAAALSDGEVQGEAKPENNSTLIGRTNTNANAKTETNGPEEDGGDGVDDGVAVQAPTPPEIFQAQNGTSDDDEDYMEDERIGGVFFEDDDGQLVEFYDDDEGEE